MTNYKHAYNLIEADMGDETANRVVTALEYLFPGYGFDSKEVQYPRRLIRGYSNRKWTKKEWDAATFAAKGAYMACSYC